MLIDAVITPAASPGALRAICSNCSANIGRLVIGSGMYRTQILPSDERTNRNASFRVISDKLLTFFEQCEQKRTRSFPAISFQFFVHGEDTSTESIKLFLDIVIPS